MDAWCRLVMVAVGASSACTGGGDEFVPIDAAAPVDAASPIDATVIDAPTIDDAAIDAAIDAAALDAGIDAPPLDPPEFVAEPYNALSLMKVRAEAYFQTHGTFPIGATPLTPALPCCLGAGMRCPGIVADWNLSPWNELGFAMLVPFRYQYSYFSTAGGAGATAIATGDLDCDGQFSDFTLTCTSSGAFWNCDIVEPAVID